MKDKNGIEICCENCRCVCKYDSMCLAHTPPSFFRPTSEALEARIADLEKKEPKTCDDCWLQRDFGNYIPAGYCADKCAKIYNALKD